MNPTSPADWIALLIDARLFGLADQEQTAKAALASAGFKFEFASDLST